MCRESREDKECLLTKSRKDKKDRKRIVVAATGASGLPILKMCLQIIREDSDYESILILSDSAKITLQQETKDTVEEIEALADQVCDTKDIGAGPASGSFRTEGMLIVPCSMKTVAGIHSGYADNLILRAADVTIKEQRTRTFLPFTLISSTDFLLSILISSLYHTYGFSNVHPCGAAYLAAESSPTKIKRARSKRPDPDRSSLSDLTDYANSEKYLIVLTI